MANIEKITGTVVGAIIRQAVRRRYGFIPGPLPDSRLDIYLTSYWKATRVTKVSEGHPPIFN